MYGFTIQNIHLPCLHANGAMQDRQRYTNRLNDKQTTALLRVTCQRSRDGIRENDILQTVRHNSYNEDPYANEFGIKITQKLASVDARILPPPWLKRLFTSSRSMEPDEQGGCISRLAGDHQVC